MKNMLQQIINYFYWKLQLINLVKLEENLPALDVENVKDFVKNFTEADLGNRSKQYDGLARDKIYDYIKVALSIKFQKNVNIEKQSYSHIDRIDPNLVEFNGEVVIYS